MSLLAMTEEEIETAALTDPDNPPWTAEGLERVVRERRAAGGGEGRAEGVSAAVGLRAEGDLRNEKIIARRK